MPIEFNSRGNCLIGFKSDRDRDNDISFIFSMHLPNVEPWVEGQWVQGNLSFEKIKQKNLELIQFHEKIVQFAKTHTNAI